MHIVQKQKKNNKFKVELEQKVAKVFQVAGCNRNIQFNPSKVSESSNLFVNGTDELLHKSPDWGNTPTAHLSAESINFLSFHSSPAPVTYNSRSIRYSVPNGLKKTKKCIIVTLTLL